ncbi:MULTISPECIES: lysylphosphatidylglycerol synthase transmembrane domain-containing protein [unclassified Rhodococcus (in: high G+C Gram-positive bacteria)]|uniref:lysylphosphatidylglycerol synthase transmembrane domain-containing protein n=1 Tax=unclassified Rhodococcus (in: high G+C Gram-positive bacteria) TaxID=192944 RepID=UPI000B9AF9E7|nr:MULTISPECIES: lysylphosphatidylglycerol synthase transmembrane domain-containing protein [unclassified Rhodococcus (in: high G+C Gram-positive bacteria)]MBY4207626.1 flippase-like domain-containing protein [Rhodococcus fascians]MBY4275850.1 flippase-like domain-containing protein [Rhodococcus fascians]MBY4433358.1 flippase-like domain-containing protein [Rhodococcus fascians]OZD65846.1 TIGR00374 family protein [Rhodococcus sp. 06-1460-1B]OZD66090.1 TIGR00374 family protein [Rhodococcus sp. 
MRVDGRDVPVAGNLLQPLVRRTSDIIRVVAASVFLSLVIAGSLITRNQWDALEQSVSNIVGVLSPDQSNAVYIVYGVAILALPFGVLIGLIAGRKWKLLAGYAAAALIAALALSITGTGISTPTWDLDVPERLDTFLSQFLDDSRWIAMLAAALTVSGPGLPARWRRAWWALLLAFVPIHLVVSTVVPARSLLGLAVGWLVGAIIVLLVGTPALEVPLDAAVRLFRSRGVDVRSFTVVRPAGPGPLVLNAHTPDADVVVELYGQNQRSGGALRQFWRWITRRGSETAPLHASMRRAVEHRALMGLAIKSMNAAGSDPLAVAALDRGWTLYAHSQPIGDPIEAELDDAALRALWSALNTLHENQISHGDLHRGELRLHDGAALFCGFGHAELGASDAQMQSDVAQLLLTTADLFGSHRAVATAVEVLGIDVVIAASGRLTKSAIPLRVRQSVADAGKTMKSVRLEVLEQTGAARIEAEQVTRFSRNQIISLVLLIGLVYVAYPFISAVPAFVVELGSVDWWWALLGLAVSALTYIGAGAALWACAFGKVSFRNLTIMQVANTFAATTTPAGVGGLALSVRFLQKGGLGTVRATAAVALQQSVQVITHVSLLIFFSVVAGTSSGLSNMVPGNTVLYLIAGVAFGVVGTFMFVPKLRLWLKVAVRPQVAEVLTELGELARDPKRFSIIILGCAATTLGAALALWASVEAFGGGTTFVTVTVVTMIGGTLASAAPTPGGVGAVEAALIGGLAAFGLPASIAVPSVLLYRVLTCWLPVFLGWPTLRWLTKHDMV